MRLLHSKVPALVLLVGLTVAVSASVVLTISANNAHLRRVQQATNVLSAAMTTELQAVEASLSAVRDAAAVAAIEGDDVGAPRAGWPINGQRFVEVLEVGLGNGTLGPARAAALIRAVPRDAIEAYTADVAQLGGPADFTVHPANNAAIAYIVEAISPLADNRGAIGFDLASESRRRQAVERGRDTGTPALTPPIDLIQGGGNPAVLLFVPAYDVVEIPQTAPVRRSRFVGGFTAVLEPQTLLATSVVEDLGLDVGLLDVGQIGLDATAGGTTAGEPLAGQDLAHPQVTMDLHAGDRRWRLVTSAGPDFGGPDLLPAVIVAVSLLLLTVTMAMLIEAQLNREARTKALVEVRTQDLRRSQESLEQANRRLRDADDLKTSFLVTISHELRTPLASIRGFTALLRGQVGEPSAEDRLAYVEQLAASTDGLADLLHEVLEFAEIEAQGPSDVAEDFEVAGVVQGVVDGQPSTHPIQVTGSGLAHGDPGALGHALANVLANARAYSPPGSPVAIHVHATDSETVEVVVDDDGPGIPADERERVFERFHRGDDAAGTVPGTGIGLTLARKLLEAMGGTINAAEPTSGGARLVLSVPAPQPGTQPADLGAQQAL